MAIRSSFPWILLFVLAASMMGGAQAQSGTSVWQPTPVNFPEILFSIAPGKTTWWPPVGDGDELSDVQGKIVATNAQLLRNFSPPETFAPVDYGLDALQEMSWGPMASAVPVTYFSLNKGFQDAKLGWISDGDLLADTGRIVARNKDLMARFHPMPPLADMGLDAAFIPYFLPQPATSNILPPEIWFSTVRGWQDEKLGRISEGDLLSSNGYVVAYNRDLLRNFRPVPTVNFDGTITPVPTPIDYGLDAVYVPFYRPWYGAAVTNAATAGSEIVVNSLPLEIWFSVKVGFTDKNLGPISDGDLLSTTGKVVRTNAQLLHNFPNPTMGPIQLNYGLDAVSARGRKVILTDPVMYTTMNKVGGNQVTMVFDGPVDLPDGAPALSVTIEGGGDVTAAFDVSLATTNTAGDTVVITEKGDVLPDGTTYTVQPANALPVEPFILDTAKLAGDADGNGAVDVVDLLSLVDTFGLSQADAGYDATCDFNNDGAVDVIDLLVLVGNFGK